MKGIILAAGAGTRLVPATIPISKILLPIYDKPMIYYPLCTLMSAGIRDILVIANERDIERFRDTLRDGSQFGIKITYEIQYAQRGIADAFIIGERYIDKDDVTLILGDNVYSGDGMDTLLEKAIRNNVGATIFGYRVEDPERFGVVEYDEDMNVLSLKEKPKKPKSNYIATGLYVYDSEVCEIAKQLKPSKRGELEITDLNNVYLKKKELRVVNLKTEFSWFDAGTFESMLEASEYVRKIEKSGKMIACPEEIAFRKGFVSAQKILEWTSIFKESPYTDHVKGIVKISEK